MELPNRAVYRDAQLRIISLSSHFFRLMKPSRVTVQRNSVRVEAEKNLLASKYFFQWFFLLFSMVTRLGMHIQRSYFKLDVIDEFDRFPGAGRRS